MSRITRRILARFTLTILILALPALVRAATLTVTSAADDNSTGTLRQVINSANPGDTIAFDPTVFATNKTIKLAQGTINITQNLTIDGPPDGVGIDGENLSNIFTIGTTGAATVSLANLALFNGVTTGAEPGGAIAVNGSLTLANCTLEFNSASNGGAIFVNPLGTLTLNSCSLNNNDARGSGGGIYVGNGGTLSLTNDTFLANDAVLNGGAIFDTLGATLNITNSTFSHNFATGPTASGGAIYSDGANITIANSIFGSDFASPTGQTEIDSFSSNSNFPPTVSVTTSDIFVPGASSQFGALNFDPLFLVFGNYGGLAGTLPLAISSPCYGAGTALLAPTVDARGFTRPNPPSMGAFDLPFAVAPPPVITPISGFLQSVTEVTINPGEASLSSGSVIYVTTDGTMPTTSSPVYNRPFNTVSAGTETVQAINTIPGYTQSPPASATYFITSAAPSYPAGLQLFSVPYSYPGVNLDTLFGYAGVKLAVWDPSASEYDIMTGTGSIEPGVGYWGRFPQAVTFTSIGAPAPANVPFTITLKPGWNQIGDPYSVSLSITSLTFGSKNITFAQASLGQSPLIGATVYRYDPSANNNAGGYDATTVLNPEVGYWIFASANTTMEVPPI